MATGTGVRLLGVTFSDDEFNALRFARWRFANVVVARGHHYTI